MFPSLSSLLIAFSFLYTVVSAAGNDTASTCTALEASLPEDVFFPESTTYNTSISSYPFIQLRLHPTCLIRPNSTADVVTAVDVLRDSGHTKFAVRGGGHNANKGFNNIEDGVTIDMRSLNAVEVVGDVVKVGAGAIWQDVYDVVEKYNVTVMGGRIGVVGVAGFLTGGGISFFSPELGWACDYVVNFEIVLANSTVVNANSTSNPTLFAALKGGQNNFGIITRFDLKSFPVTPLWGGRIGFAPTADTALFEGFTQFKMAEYDPYAAGWVTNRYNGTSKAFAPNSILWYTRPELKPGALEHMTNVTPQVMNGMTTASPSAFARNASMVVKISNLNTIWATTTFHISPTIIHSIHNKWKAVIPALCESYAYANIASELTFQSLAPPPRDGAPANSLGFDTTSTPESDLVFLQIIFYFSDSAALPGLNNALQDFITMFDEIADGEGVGHDFVYLNFAAAFQDPLKAYGTEEVGGLRQVAKSYDPHGLFQRQLVGGFKVFGNGYGHGPGNGSYGGGRWGHS